MEYIIFDREEYPELLSESIGCAVITPWEPYVRRMLDKLETLRSSGADVKVIQIKEKFGSLRVYSRVYNQELEGIDAKVDEIVQEAVTASANICSVCGSTAEVQLSLRTPDSGWLLRLCKEHRSAEENL